MNVPNIVVGGHWTCKECGAANISSVRLCVKCQTPRRGKAQPTGVGPEPQENHVSVTSVGLSTFTLRGENEVVEMQALLELRQGSLECAIKNYGEHTLSSQRAKAELETVQAILDRLRNERAHHETTVQMREMAGKTVEKKGAEL